MAAQNINDLATIRARAAQHQLAIEQRTRWLTPQQVAASWGVSVSTVRSIAHAELPYIELGKGRLLKRRRYHPDDVRAFEAKGRTSR